MKILVLYPLQSGKTTAMLAAIRATYYRVYVDNGALILEPMAPGELYADEGQPHRYSFTPIPD